MKILFVSFEPNSQIVLRINFVNPEPTCRSAEDVGIDEDPIVYGQALD